MEILNLHIVSVMLAITAYVYSDVLTEPGMIFHPLFKKLESTLPVWLFKPLIGCYKCVAGQVALWYYLFAADHYDLRLHTYFICLTIFLSIVSCKITRNS